MIHLWQTRTGCRRSLSHVDSSCCKDNHTCWARAALPSAFLAVEQRLAGCGAWAPTNLHTSGSGLELPLGSCTPLAPSGRVGPSVPPQTLQHPIHVTKAEGKEVWSTLQSCFGPVTKGNLPLLLRRRSQCCIYLNVIFFKMWAGTNPEQLLHF